MDDISIFISWSKGFGKEFAELLKVLIIYLYGIKPERIFVSSQDLNETDWIRKVLEKAHSCNIGISCLTRDTYKNEWLLYELGAMSPRAQVYTIAIDFPIDELIFDGYRRCKCITGINSDVFGSGPDFDYLFDSLFISLEGNEKCKPHFDSKMRSKRLGELKGKSYLASVPIFDENWNITDKKIEINLKKRYEFYNKKYDLFVSRPMLGVDDGIKDLIEHVCNNEKIFYSRNEKTPEHEQAKRLIGERVQNIRNSKQFLLIYPKAIAQSGCLIELGMALTYGKPITVFYEDENTLPSFIKWVIEGDKVREEERAQYNLKKFNVLWKVEDSSESQNMSLESLFETLIMEEIK